ncbi:hypothetical protein ABZ345_47385, partial [Lentzea sp. NPDC005914]|uniref:hypothetical protein n=1 Tax=Lentzea sp. NPDC005914 TaxID=3154572 RepID=UPI0033E8A6EC
SGRCCATAGSSPRPRHNPLPQRLDTIIQIPSGVVQVFTQRVGDWLQTVTPSHHFLGFDTSLCKRRSLGGRQVTLLCSPSSLPELGGRFIC